MKLSLWLITVSGLGGVLGYVFGEWEGFLTVLICAVVVDYITGVIAAGVQGKLNSSVGYKGILKKAGIFGVVAICNLLDRIMPGTNGALRQGACIFYIGNEVLSVIENAGAMGIVVPEVLKKAVERLKKGE